MAKSSENYTLAAKVRGMYGRRLTAENYRELLRKQTVNEVAAYLKQETGYAALLRDINESLVHRGELESILRKQVFEEYSRMMYYVESDERPFCDYVVVGMEIREILSCIRLVNAGRAGEYFFSFPAYFAKHASFDLYKLAKVKTLEDLTETLAGTPYQAILSKFPLNENGKIDTVLIEHALRQYYYERIFSTIRRTYKSKVSGQIRQAFGMEADLSNLLLLYRQKKYFNAPSSYIESLLLPYHSLITDQEYRQMLQEPDAEAVWRDIFATKYGKLFSKYSYKYLEKYCDQIQYDFFRKMLKTGVSTPEILVSYMYLKNTELNNLVHIIEGIRYSLTPSEIEKLLIQTR